MRFISKIFILLLVVTLLHCGGSAVQTNTQPVVNGQVTLNLFSLGTDFPTDIQIPNIPTMNGTAFIVTDNPALGVVPVDLDTQLFSQTFAGLDATPSSIASVLQYARRLKIISPSQALLLGGAGIVYFNPATGAVFETLSLKESIILNESLSLSRPADVDNNGSLETSITGNFTPSFIDSLAVVGDRIFITASNLFFDGASGNPGYFAQGLLLILEIHDTPPFLRPATTDYLVLDGFNPTALTVFQGSLFITITGATELEDAGQTPLTDAKVIKLNPQNLQILDMVNLGLVSANYRPLAITADGSRAFLGSAAYSEVYELNLQNFTVERGANNPIVISGLNSDFITDQKIDAQEQTLYVSSFNNNRVYKINLQAANPQVDSESFNFALEPNPGLTGAGPMAFRPGTPGVDFIGPDLWILTGSPGTLSALQTY